MGFERQSYKNFEVIIADDGSKRHVVDEINSLNHSFTIKHCWHEDLGWRKNIALNHAIKISLGDYLIFCDGDCIPHKHFVRNHYRAKKSGYVLTGRRVMLSKAFRELLTEEFTLAGKYENLFTLYAKKCWHTECGFYMPLWISFWYVQLKDNKKGLLGSNMSLFKKEIEEVNGFDERFAGPGIGEDTDIDYRLRFAGKKIRILKHYTIQYHIFHKLLERSSHEENTSLLNENIERKVTFTPFGIKKQD